MPLIAARASRGAGPVAPAAAGSESPGARRREGPRLSRLVPDPPSSSFTAVGLMTGPDFVNSVFIFPPPAGGGVQAGEGPWAPNPTALLGERLRRSPKAPLSS